MSPSRWIATAAVWGALSIALGAFAAHGLSGFLDTRGWEGAEKQKRQATFETAAEQQIYAALALLGAGVAAGLSPGRMWSAAAWQVLLGSTIFSGCCYTLALVEGCRWLGAVVPVGGVLTITGWLSIAAAALRTDR